MTWASTPLATTLDGAIVLGAVLGTAAWIRHRKQLAAADFGSGYALAVLGVVIIGLLFFADALVRLLPAAFPSGTLVMVDGVLVSSGRLVGLLAVLGVLLAVLVGSRRAAALIEQYERATAAYNSLFEHVAVGAYRAGADGRILRANLALVRMLGYQETVEVLRLDPATDIFADPSDYGRFLTRAGGSSWVDGFETEWKRRGGERMAVRLSGASHGFTEDEATCFEILVEDLSTKQELEAQLRQAQKMEAVGQLTGGIAHDFNNLLTVIQANADSVAALISREQRDLHVSLEELQAAARRGTAMVRRLLSFSRRSMISLRALDLNELLVELVPSLRRLLPAGIEIRYEAEDPLPAVHADPGAVEQILVNLVTNARDAMPQGGTLTIELRSATLDEEHRTTRGWGDPGRYVRLLVADTGIGIDRSTQDRIFEPFFTTKPVGQGTGLGMAIIYGLMKQHRGFVDVYSELGKGTSMKVYFPLASERVTPSPAVRMVEPSGGTETILMAEDEAPIRRAAKRVLERYGYTVIVAADGEEALHLFQQQKDEIDLVISDVVMPKMGGPQLYEAVRKESAEIKFLFSSGYRAEDIQLDVLPEPTVPFLDKPWTVMELLQHVREVLDQQRSAKPEATPTR